MKHLLVAVVALALLLGGVVGVGRYAFAASPKAPKMSVQILSPTGTIFLQESQTLHVLIRTTGLTPSPNFVKNAPGQGHVHIYIDCIPPDAYVKPDLASPCWEFQFPKFLSGAPGGTMTMAGQFAPKTARVRLSKGPHLLLVALANNNHVLYRAPASAIVFVLK